MTDTFHEHYAQIYDSCVPDWPGEIEFYKEVARGAHSRGERVLELGCGTGRVAVRLAQEGVNITGLDISEEMLNEARAKSRELPNVRWIQGDMRDFKLGDHFGLVIIPGHAFMTVTTPEGQLSCLQRIRGHLDPKGTLVVHVDHQDMRFLANASSEPGRGFGPGESLINPRTGRAIKLYKAWRFARSTQTANFVMAWEDIGQAGQVLERWESDPVPIHCIFRFEMEHLLARAGFQVNALYGDFARHELSDQSHEMIWVANKAGEIEAKEQ